MPRATGACWTCRIRKKRCDENRPACGGCVFRQLCCHGYGEKPKFMYREEDQRAEIEKIQRAVNDSLRARRTFRAVKKQGRLVPTQPIALAVERADPNTKEAFQFQPLVYTEPSRLRQDQGSSPMPDPWPNTFDNPRPWGFPGDTHTLNLKGSSMQSTGFHPAENNISYPFAFHPAAPPAENVNDLEMIMNYLDNIFPLQYYFYQPSAAERGRGWLLNLLLRSKPLYYTALSFGVIQKVFASRDDVVHETQFLEELDHHHSLALAGLAKQLEELPTLSGQEHLKLGVEVLACTIQLLSIEVFRSKKWWKGWKGDWEVHLNAAGALLSVIGNELDLSASPGDSPTSDDSPESQIKSDSDSMSGFLSEIAGLDFFMTGYIWSDIMRCANVGLTPSKQDSFFYLNYLEDGRIQLNRVMGCRNWAMISIREISGLEAWRNEMLSGLRDPVLTGQPGGIDNLVVPLLTRKSNEIQDRLQRGFSSTATNLDSLTTYDREIELVTNVFGLSAVIYLALVVCGSFGKLPEVQRDVLIAFSAMKALPKHLLMRVCWPYCAAGCMAEGRLREDFRQLTAETMAQGHPMGQLWNALDLMEEFWKIRETMIPGRPIDGCPWVLAMKSTEMKTPLI